jgi:HD-GYP domain-containing protein (c-di-GMP phosphodiesterase class II)
MMQTLSSGREVCLDKVMVDELRVGMQVSELDRPWMGTPFMFQGFRIRSAEEIKLLQKCCDYVYVSRDAAPVDFREVRTRRATEHVPVSKLLAVSSKGQYGGRYHDSVTAEDELVAARKIFPECQTLIRDVFNTAEHAGSVSLPRIRNMTDAIVDSVLRNPDAFMMLQNIDNRAPYRYRHAVNCCGLAAAFCRSLGFRREEIRDIALGALLLDIGTVRLPGEMLDMQAPLSPLLQKLTRHHVDFGLDIVQESQDLPAVVEEMIRTHHERVDGRGYPAGMRGEQIPVSGRIAAIVDCYDAMINERPYREGMSPVAAISELYKWRDIDFHADLVEKFIQCIGACPTGSLVELNSGQVGVVLSQNRLHRLYPRVLVIMEADRSRCERTYTVDLWEQCKRTRGETLDIRRVLQPEDVSIDLADCCQ